MGAVQGLLKRLFELLDFSLPLYCNEGKSQLVIAVGCTGGHHRSVTFAQAIYGPLALAGPARQRQSPRYPEELEGNAVSFSSRVKQEFCKAKLQRASQKRAMCYGLLLFGRSFGEKGISLQSECVAAVKLAADLLAELTGAIVSTQTALRRATHAVCTLSVPDSGDVLRVLSYLATPAARSICA